jgi:hypothetical protein
MIAEYWRRLKCLWRSAQFERDLEEEMRLHVHLRAERLGDLDAARRRFGNTTLLRSERVGPLSSGGWRGNPDD